MHVVRWTPVLLALAGCQAIIGLDTFTHDAPLGTPCPATAPGPDEDGDGCADNADNCPTVANASQIDTDGDLVGDECDPHPTQTGDSIASVAFLDSSFDGGWKVTAGKWTFAAGAAANTADDAITHQQDVAGAYLTVDLTFTATMYTSAASSLRVELKDPTGAGVTCHVDYNAVSPTTGTFDTFLTGASDSLNNPSPTSSLRVQTDKGGSYCYNGAEMLMTPATLMTGASTATIRLNGIQVTIPSIVIYESIPP